MFSGIPQQHPGFGQFVAMTAQQNPMFGVPIPQARGQFSGMGPLGGLAMPAVNQYFGDAGYVAGQFLPTQGLYDQLKARDYQKQRYQQISAATDADRETHVELLRNAGKKIGVDWGQEQEAAAQQIAADMSAIAPILSQIAPEAYDRNHGNKGSATVMAQALSRTSNMLVSSDGTQGLSAEDVGAFSRRIEEDLYGTPEKIRAMKGIGMGSAGLMMEEMSLRGMQHRSIGTYDRGSQMDMLATEMVDSGESSSVDSAMEELKQFSQSDVDAKMRDFDAGQVSQKLKKMSGAVSAMRDIFGGMGVPDAPMAQIMNGLNTLTQGSFATMSAGEVEKTVRTIKSLSDRTGMSVAGIAAMTVQARNYIDAMGLERPLAVQAGMHSAAFSQAYGNLEYGEQWGTQGKDVATQMDARLTAQAAGSKTVNRAGAYLRTMDAFGQDVDSGSRAGKLLDAIKSGDTRFEGRDMSEVLRPQEMQKIMQESGMSNNAVRAFDTALTDPFGNQKEIAENDLAVFGRTLQGQDIKRNVGVPAASQAISGALRASGADSATIRKAQGAAPKLAEMMLNGDFDPNTPEGRREMAEVIRGDLEAAGVDVTDDMMQGIGEEAFSNYNMITRQRGGQGDLIKDRQQFSDRTMRESGLVMDSAAMDTEMSVVMAAFGNSGPVRRIVDMIASDEDIDIREAVSEALGGTDKEELIEVLVPKLEEASGLYKELRDEGGDGEGGRYTERQIANRRKRIKQIDAIFGNNRISNEWMESLAEETGMSVDEIAAPGGKEKARQKLVESEGYEEAGANARLDDFTEHLVGHRGVRTALEDEGVDVGRHIGEESAALVARTGETLTDLIKEGDGPRIAANADALPARLHRFQEMVLGDEKTFMRIGEDAGSIFSGLEADKESLLSLGEDIEGGIGKVLSDSEHPLHDQAKELVGSITSGMNTVQERMQERTPLASGESPDIKKIREDLMSQFDSGTFRMPANGTGLSLQEMTDDQKIPLSIEELREQESLRTQQDSDEKELATLPEGSKAREAVEKRMAEREPRLSELGERIGSIGEEVRERVLNKAGADGVERVIETLSARDQIQELVGTGTGLREALIDPEHPEHARIKELLDTATTGTRELQEQIGKDATSVGLVSDLETDRQDLAHEFGAEESTTQQKLAREQSETRKARQEHGDEAVEPFLDQSPAATSTAWDSRGIAQQGDSPPPAVEEDMGVSTAASVMESNARQAKLNAVIEDAGTVAPASDIEDAYAAEEAIRTSDAVSGEGGMEAPSGGGDQGPRRIEGRLRITQEGEGYLDAEETNVGDSDVVAMRSAGGN